MPRIWLWTERKAHQIKRLYRLPVFQRSKRKFKNSCELEELTPRRENESNAKNIEDELLKSSTFA
jgi:hypothetical protein